MSRPDARVPRFTRAERITHWANATLWGLALLSGLYFKFGWGQSLLTDREMVRIAHVVIGFAIIAVFLVSLLGRYGAALRRDLAGPATTSVGCGPSGATGRSDSASSTPARS